MKSSLILNDEFKETKKKREILKSFNFNSLPSYEAQIFQKIRLKSIDNIKKIEHDLEMNQLIKKCYLSLIFQLLRKNANSVFQKSIHQY